MPGIETDLTQWPVVFTKFDGEQSAEELETYITQMTRLHARKERYVGIAWMKRYSRGQAQVDRMGRWLKETEVTTRAYCVATGLIADSAGFRFVLSAVFLIRPMPIPYQVCGKFDDAVKFCRGEADKRGL